MALLRLEGAIGWQAAIIPEADRVDSGGQEMSKAIRIHRPGGPEEMVWEEVEVAAPGPGQVLLRQTAVGLNYIDVYHRTGLYPLSALPAVLGMEAAAVVEAVGDGVGDLRPGQRVAYASPPPGAYAERRLMPADRLVPLPDSIDDVHAAAMMLQGMTAQYLLRRTYRVQPGDAILVHAAAGGVGTILCQWGRHLGATVIGTVGSDEKAEIARANGCHHVIVYTRENFAERVRALTNGEGVAVVYDGVGKTTFDGSLDSLRPLGMMVSYGNASGPGAAVRTGHPVAERIAVLHPADADALHGEDRRPAGLGPGAVRRGRRRPRADQRQPDLPARRSSPRPSPTSKPAKPPVRRCCCPSQSAAGRRPRSSSTWTS